MKKLLIILFFISIAGATGFALYQSIKQKEKANVFEVIPSDASIIIEVSDINSFNEEIKSKEYLGYTKRLPFLSVVLENLLQIDSIIDFKKENQGKLQKFVTSFHITPGSKMGWISFVPVGSDQVMNILAEAASQRKLTVSDHQFHDYTIYSISHPNDQKLSYFYYRGLLVMSSGSALSEDVIRKIDKKSNSFLPRKEEIRSENFLIGKIRVYLKYESFSNLWPSVSLDSSGFLKDFAKESIFELTLNEKELVLNGYTFASHNKKSYINIIKGQAPQKFAIRNYIPNSSTAVFYLGFDKPGKLGEELSSFWKSSHPELIEEIQNTEKEFGIRLKDFYNYLGKEVAVCSLAGDSENAKLLLIEAADTDKLAGFFEEIATKATPSGKIRKEEHKGVEIIEIPIHEFPEKLLGTAFHGFSKSYFAQFNNHLAVSDSPDMLKSLLRDINSENVWGKTLDMNTFLGEGISEFNIGYFANLPAVYKGNKSFENYGFMGAQFVDVGETVLSNIVITHHIDNIAVQDSPDLKEEVILEHAIENIFPVNGVTSDKGVLVQDSLNNIYLVSEKGLVKWHYTLGSKISTDLNCLDINRDRKSDLIFGAGNKIYAFDRKGKEIKNFPILLPDSSSIVNLTLVDYIGHQQYRLIASDQSGNIYLYNLKGENLEGWQPLKTDGRLVDEVKHVRVAAKDMLIAVEENGTIQVRNRRGESYDNFPLKLNKKIISNVLIQKGKSLENSFISVLTEDLTLYKISMEGKFNDQQLDTTSTLCRELKGGGWLLAKKENKGINVIDGDGDNKAFLPVAASPTFYQEFASGKKVFFVNKGRRSFELLDKNGNILLPDLPSLTSPVLQFIEGQEKYLLYSSEGNKLRLTRF